MPTPRPPLWPDLWIWSSSWLGLATACAQAAIGGVLGRPFDPVLAALAFCGTVAVYTRDHLRGMPHEGATSPHRAAFLEAYGDGIRTYGRLCLVAAVGLALLAGPRIVALAGVGLALGLLHERLKHRAWSKPIYVALAWTIVVVGVPAAAAPTPPDVGWLAVVAFGTAMANVWLYNLRPEARLYAQVGPRRGRLVAAACLAVALAAALLGPEAIRPATAFPLAMALGLFAPPLTERSVAWAIDGDLLLGAAGTLVWAAC